MEKNSKQVWSASLITSVKLKEKKYQENGGEIVRYAITSGLLRAGVSIDFYLFLTTK